MPLRFFSICARLPDPNSQDELNHFLSVHRIVSVRKDLVSDSSGAYWAIAVEYLNRLQDGTQTVINRRESKQVDYREVLSPAQFALFAELRNIRKQIATREGVPIYTIFTNQQLADMVTGHVDSKTALSKVNGVGASRVDKYGDEFLKAIVNFEANKHEAREQSVSEDS